MEHNLEWVRTASSIASRRERRPEKRHPILCPAVIVFAQGEGRLDCTIRDITESGARIAYPRNSRFPGNFHLINMRDRTVHESRVVWSSDCQAGLAFGYTLPLEDIVDPALEFINRLWMESVMR